MGLFSRKKTHYSSVSNLSNHLWHYEGEKTYEDCDPGTGFFGGKFRTRDRFSHYMAAGGLQYESRLKRQEREPVEHRTLIIRCLIAFALFWALFYFIRF